MQQNKYDDARFFEGYSRMARSVEGLDAAGEWPAFQTLLPELRGKAVLDLGCGFGWHCRYAWQQGARRVLGIDLSERMLARARAETEAGTVEYRRSSIEDLDLAGEPFDVVISSLALHYVASFEGVCRKVATWLVEGGSFVFSVEHPMFTALAAQEWCCGPSGERRHWPVDDYHVEGVRHTSWLAEDVVKYHRTMAAYINGLIDSGFRLKRVVEPTLSSEMLERRPEWIDERRRPMFLLASGVKES